MGRRSRVEGLSKCLLTEKSRSEGKNVGGEGTKSSRKEEPDRAARRGRLTWSQKEAGGNLPEG